MPQLRQEVSARLNPDGDAVDKVSSPATDANNGAARMSRFLFDAITAGAIVVNLSAAIVTSRVSERPIASPLARLQAQWGTVVTNQRQNPIRLSQLDCLVIRALDGW
jgi:hypothetical protein